MDNVKIYSRFIKRIVTSPELIRVKLLKSSNRKEITAISEIVYNIIHKNIQVDRSTLVQLKKFKRVFYKLVSAKDALARKQILIDNPKCLVSLAILFR
jgi:RNA-binding protein YhbY